MDTIYIVAVTLCEEHSILEENDSFRRERRKNEKEPNSKQNGNRMEIAPFHTTTRTRSERVISLVGDYVIFGNRRGRDSERE